MEIVKFAQAAHYTLPGHDEIIARRLQGADASSAEFAVIGHSHFPVGAVVPMDAGAIGKVYVVTQGALTMEQGDGTRHVLGVNDSIFIPAGEARAVLNESGAPAAMIVVTPPAK